MQDKELGKCVVNSRTSPFLGLLYHSEREAGWDFACPGRVLRPGHRVLPEELSYNRNPAAATAAKGEHILLLIERALQGALGHAVVQTGRAAWKHTR